MPFGMVQLSPDTDPDSGLYRHKDTVIYGFSFAHSPGHWGEIMLMPTNGRTKKSEDWRDAWKSEFSKDAEKAEPGYYAVHLNNYGIDVEITSEKRSAIQRYQLQNGDTCRLFVDLMHGNELAYYDIRAHGDTAISGYRASGRPGREDVLSFYLVFSRPFIAFDQLMHRTNMTHPETGKIITVMEEIQAFSLLFPPSQEGRNELIVKGGLSFADERGATANVYHEIPGWEFESIRQRAEETWNETLHKTAAQAVNANETEILSLYYTSLYRLYLSVQLKSDADGRYRGADHIVHSDKTYERYGGFPLKEAWFNFFPLMARIEPGLAKIWLLNFADAMAESDQIADPDIPDPFPLACASYELLQAGSPDGDLRPLLYSINRQVEREEKKWFSASALSPVKFPSSYFTGYYALSQIALLLGDDALSLPLRTRAYEWTKYYPVTGHPRELKAGDRFMEIPGEFPYVLFDKENFVIASGGPDVLDKNITAHFMLLFSNAGTEALNNYTQEELYFLPRYYSSGQQQQRKKTEEALTRGQLKRDVPYRTAEAAESVNTVLRIGLHSWQQP